jgi:3-deoxy-manno-octulosonate cytidylyltransferase (CMP-KDO synthetase)
VAVLGVIPVRMAASRLPGKPLADLGGRPVVGWVLDAASGSDRLDRVVVATPDEEIAAVARSLGAEVVMTRSDHETGTDRVAEVAGRLPDYDVVVNIQGDQPFVSAGMLAELVAPYFASADAPPMTTLGAPLAATDVTDPNVVKVVCDRNGDALYFSRSPIPYHRTPGDAPVYHHLGLYAFTRDFLARYPALPPTPLERVEGLEQLRVLEHGHRIRVCTTRAAVREINTADDLDRARARISGVMT